MVIHDESHKGHDCSFCGKNFRWTTSLNSHIKAAHSVVFKSFECEECGKVFKVRDALHSMLLAKQF